jgi:CHAT domain-containing protein
MKKSCCLILLICISWQLAAQETLAEKIAAINELPPAERAVRFQEAIASGNHAALETASLRHELGVTYYRLSRPFDAVEETEKALALRLADETGAGEELFYSAYNLGSFHYNLGDYDQAFAAFQLILDRAPNVRVGFTLYRLGSMYREIGEYQLSEQAFAEAAKLDDFPKDSGARATLLSEWSYLYIVQDEMAAAEKAIPLLEEALDIYERLAAGDDYYAAEPSIILNRLGLAYTHAAQYPKAQTFFNRALRSNEECCEDEEQEAAIYSNMGIAYRRSSQLQKALEAHQHALAILLRSAEAGKTAPWTALGHDNIATTLLDMKRYEEGLAEIQQAITWLLPAFTPKDQVDNPPRELLQTSPHKSDLLIVLKDKAALWQHLAQERSNEIFYQNALATYLLCDELLDLIREDHQEQQTKLHWRDQARDMYQAAVRTAWLSGQKEMAFYFSEKSRAVLLLDGLRELNASSRLPEQTRKALAKLSVQIRYLEKDIYEAEEADGGKEQELVLLRQQYRQLLDSVEISYPEYYRQKYRPDFVELSSFQKQLAKDAVWIEYFLGNDFTLALVIRPHEMDMIELTAPQELLPQIDRYLADLKSYDSAFSPATAQALYRYLIAPLGIETGHTLTLVPDGILSLIPFEALLEKEPAAGAPYRDWDFLIKSYEINYAYSVNSSNFSTGSVQQNNGRVMAFAPMAKIDAGYGIDANLELPQSRWTAEQLAGIFPTDIYLGAQANRHAFEQSSAQAGVLHLATHAYLDHEQPGFSYFLLADSLPDERKFYVNELYNYQFRADLTVLSACETGAGKLFRGEGVASIGRAFAQNGCPNLAMSLWPVDEGATGNLLERYYQQLKEGLPKGRALREAKLAYLQAAKSEQLQHPFRWAGIVYYGQNTPLMLSRPAGFNRGFLMAGILLVVLAWLLYRGYVKRSAAAKA